MTIRKQPTSIVKRQTVAIINPGEEQTVTFRQIGQVPFATRTDITVEVQPVKGPPPETRTDNNTAEYPVIFSLGQ